MARSLTTAACILLSSGVCVWAGSPHFVSCVVSVSDNMLCATGKEAGLGNENQVTIVLGGMAHCQNRGGNNPSAQNKTTFGSEETVPVQNGKALYELCVELEFQPDCDPPMTTVIDSVVLFDATNDISCIITNE